MLLGILFLFCPAFLVPILPAHSLGSCQFTNIAKAPKCLASKTALLKTQHQKSSCYSWLWEQIVV